MRQPLLIAVLCTDLVASCPNSGLGQMSSPATEIFTGVTKLRGRANGDRFDDGGGELSATGYLNRWAGLEADFDWFTLNAPKRTRLWKPLRPAGRTALCLSP